MQFPIYICAFRRCGCQKNGSHRSSNGFKYSYTKFRTTHIFASIPFELLRPDLLEPIKQIFSKFSNEEIKYRDWEPEEYEVIESEIDIEALIKTLNSGLNPCYSNRVFIKGDKDSCPYPTGFGFVSTTYDEIDYTN